SQSMQPASEALDQSKPKGPREHETVAADKGHGVNGRAVLHDLLEALQAMRAGDFTIRMRAGGDGIEGKIADTFNEIVAANQVLAHQLEAVGQVVGREGRTRKRVKLGFAYGAWGEMESSINTMIRQLGVVTSEVTRVAREVGTEGKLGGQAEVPGVTGVWKDLTESVNSMANNLTAQVRNIADVTIAVASGDLSKKITVDVRGEILQLKEAIN